MRASGNFTITGRHVLAAMLAFFATVIAVNVAFIVVATRSFPGLASKEAFSNGLARSFYAERAAHAEQRARGWRMGLEGRREADGGARLVVRMTDGEGRGLRGLALEGTLRRRVTEADDRVLSFEEAGDGRYEARLSEVKGGAWRIVLRTRFPDGAPFEEEGELWLP